MVYLMKTNKNRVLSFFLVLCLCLFIADQPAFAEASWPQCSGIQADGGILIDADSNAVLYEKNADQAYYPASITKILTALIIIENCDLDEMVTFSDNAINNVESNSSNMGTMVGDVLSVRDCLYGLMLASANEAGNALAEHLSGSIEAFTDLMNQKALELGCTGSHFANPSGLNNPDHYVTARDMAAIMRAAISNPVFVEIDGARYWKHAPIKRYPDPDDPHNTVYAHHAMIKKNDSRYYSGTFAGKTGYTSLAGNTLVTSAKKNGITLIAVILNGHQTHYQDTKTLFDFGFRNFKSVKISEFDHAYSSIENDMTFSGLSVSPAPSLSVDENCSITLPQNADFNDGRQQEAAARSLLPQESVTIPEPTTRALEDSLAEGESGTAKEQELSPMPLSADETLEKQITIPSLLWTVIGIAVVLLTAVTAFFLIKTYRERKEEQQRYLRNERRKKRLSDIGFSQSEFDLLVEHTKQRHQRRRFH